MFARVGCLGDSVSLSPLMDHACLIINKLGYDILP